MGQAPENAHGADRSDINREIGVNPTPNRAIGPSGQRWRLAAGPALSILDTEQQFSSSQPRIFFGTSQRSPRDLDCGVSEYLIWC